MSIRITLFLLILLAGSSCTVEKRLYTKGFHIEFRKPHQGSDAKDALQPKDQMGEKESELDEVIFPKTDDLRLKEENPQEEESTELVQQEETQAITELPNKEFRSTNKPISEELNPTSDSGRITTKVSIQVHFSESLMSKSLRKNQERHSANKSREIDWEEVSVWLYLIGGLIGLVLLLASMPGVSIGAALLGVLVGAVIATLVALLISSAVGNFEWFWSGR